MRIAPVILNPEQRRALEQCARARSLPLRSVERARIVLLAAEGKQDREIGAELNMTAHKVARWRSRYLGSRNGRIGERRSAFWPQAEYLIGHGEEGHSEYRAGETGPRHAWYAQHGGKR